MYIFQKSSFRSLSNNTAQFAPSGDCRPCCTKGMPLPPGRDLIMPDASCRSTGVAGDTGRDTGRVKGDTVRVRTGPTAAKGDTYEAGDTDRVRDAPGGVKFAGRDHAEREGSCCEPRVRLSSNSLTSQLATFGIVGGRRQLSADNAAALSSRQGVEE